MDHQLITKYLEKYMTLLNLYILWGQNKKKNQISVITPYFKPPREIISAKILKCYMCLFFNILCHTMIDIYIDQIQVYGTIQIQRVLIKW